MGGFLERNYMTISTDYKIEFERLLEYVKQAMGGIDVENRLTHGYTGLQILKDVMLDYQERIEDGVLDITCSYSLDGKHYMNLSEPFCIYCGAKEK